MTFKVNLVRAAQVEGSVPWIGVRLNATGRSGLFMTGVVPYDFQLTFPDSGLATAAEIDLGTAAQGFNYGLGVDLAGKAYFDVSLHAGDSEVEFGYRGVGMDDTLTMIQLESSQFLSSILHRTPLVGCRVRCANGAEGQPCVVCEASGLTVRICC